MGAASGWWVSNLAPAGSVVPVFVLPVASPLYALGLRNVTPSRSLESFLAAMKHAPTPFLDTWLPLMQTRSVMAATKPPALLGDGHRSG